MWLCYKYLRCWLNRHLTKKICWRRKMVLAKKLKCWPIDIVLASRSGGIACKGMELAQGEAVIIPWTVYFSKKNQQINILKYLLKILVIIVNSVLEVLDISWKTNNDYEMCTTHIVFWNTKLVYYLKIFLVGKYILITLVCSFSPRFNRKNMLGVNL